MKKNNESIGTARKQLVFATLPFILAVPPIVGWAIGRWLDRLFDSSPYLMYLFITFGFISAVREFYRLIKKYGAIDK